MKVITLTLKQSKLLFITTKTIEKVKKVIDINDELVECLRKGLGRYLVTNESDKLYQSSSAFTKMFIKEFNESGII